MVMPAKPELTRSWPQDRARTAARSRRCPCRGNAARSAGRCAVPAGGRPWPVASAMAVRMAAAMRDPRRGDRQRAEAGQRLGDAEERAAPDQPEEDEKEPGEQRGRPRYARSMPGIARRGQSEPRRAGPRRAGAGIAASCRQDRRRRERAWPSIGLSSSGRDSPGSKLAHDLRRAPVAHHHHRPAQPPPVPAAALPGGDHAARDLRDRLADPPPLPRPAGGDDPARPGRAASTAAGRRGAAPGRRRACPTTRWCSRPAPATPISATTSGSRRPRA